MERLLQDVRFAVRLLRRDRGFALTVLLTSASASAPTAIGILGAAALRTTLESQLYGLTATDPVVLVSVAAVLAGVAIAACALPARRVARIDPLVALTQ